MLRKRPTAKSLSVLFRVKFPILLSPRPGDAGDERLRLCQGHLVENHSDVKILILTMHTEEVFILNLMDVGVHGFLNKMPNLES